MLLKGVGVGVGAGKSEAQDSGGGMVGLTILGRPSGRAGMLDSPMLAAFIPVSGFPLSECIASGGGWQPRVAGGGWETG